MIDFLQAESKEIQVIRGAALAMSVDHNGDTYYVLQIIAGAHDGSEKTTTYAIPPSATPQLLQLMNGMDPKREESL